MRVITRLVEASEPLIERLPPDPMTFIREGDGIAGWGVHAVLRAAGPNRVASLAEQFELLVASAEIDDAAGLPGTGLVAFGAIAFADSSKSESVLIVPKVIFGSRDGVSWITSIDSAEAPKSTATNLAVSTFVSGSMSRTDFETAVLSAVDSISSGAIEKVVLARDLVATLPENFDVRPALQKLAADYPSCWVYSVDGLFGASPELLVRVSHGQVSARVLAGTAARGTDPGVDHAIGEALAASHKNVSEHAYAVDSMVKSLAPFCTHVDADSQPFSLSLPNLWHLASDVHGVLRDKSSVLDLVAAIHPTAAVAGTPRAAALELIEKLEPFDRGRYSGPVGWIGADGDGEWAIALRGAQIEGNTVRAFAGCGIVAQSEPESEASETDLKFRPIVSALNS